MSSTSVPAAGVGRSPPRRAGAPRARAPAPRARRRSRPEGYVPRWCPAAGSASRPPGRRTAVPEGWGSSVRGRRLLRARQGLCVGVRLTGLDLQTLGVRIGAGPRGRRRCEPALDRRLRQRGKRVGVPARLLHGAHQRVLVAKARDRGRQPHRLVLGTGASKGASVERVSTGTIGSSPSKTGGGRPVAPAEACPRRARGTRPRWFGREAERAGSPLGAVDPSGPPGSPLPSRALRHAASAAFAASSARRAASARPRISAWRRSSAARAASRATRATSRRDSSSARRAASARSAPERACHSSGARISTRPAACSSARSSADCAGESVSAVRNSPSEARNVRSSALPRKGSAADRVTAADPRGPRDRRERLEGGPHRTGAAHAGKGDLHQRRHEAGLLGQERHPPHRGERAQLGGRGGVHSRRLVDPRRIGQLPARPERVQHRRDERPGGEQRLRVGLVSEAETGADQIPRTGRRASPRGRRRGA